MFAYRAASKSLPMFVLSSFLISYLTSMAVTYLVASFQHKSLHHPNIFLTDALAQPPASAIGTFFFCVTALLMGYVVLIRYTEQDLKQTLGPRTTSQSATTTYNTLNALSLVIGFVSVITLIGTATFRRAEIRPVHWVFEGAFWGSTVLYAILQCVIDSTNSRYGLVSKAMVGWRFFTVALTALPLAAWIILRIASASPGTVLACGVLELCSFAALFLYFTSYIPPFSSLRLFAKSRGVEVDTEAQQRVPLMQGMPAA